MLFDNVQEICIKIHFVEVYLKLINVNYQHSYNVHHYFSFSVQ